MQVIVHQLDLNTIDFLKRIYTLNRKGLLPMRKEEATQEKMMARSLKKAN